MLAEQDQQSAREGAREVDAMPIRRDPKTGKFAPNGGRKSSGKGGAAARAKKGADHIRARMKKEAPKKARSTKASRAAANTAAKNKALAGLRKG